MLRLSIVAALLLSHGCGPACDHDAYCDGTTVVSCTESEEDESYESRYDCRDDVRGVPYCVALEGENYAFCSSSAVPLAECEAAEAAFEGDYGAPACIDGAPQFCRGGFPSDQKANACAAGTTCLACMATHPDRQFAGCAIGTAPEPACTPPTRSSCDDATNQRFDCTCGWRSLETACPVACVTRELDAQTFGLCGLADAPDARCGTPNQDGDSGFCDGDVAVECFLGVPVRRATCEAGLCAPMQGIYAAHCSGIEISSEGEPRGGAGGVL